MTALHGNVRSKLFGLERRFRLLKHLIRRRRLKCRAALFVAIVKCIESCDDTLKLEQKGALEPCHYHLVEGHRMITG